jgi:hypothetical protein
VITRNFGIPTFVGYGYGAGDADGSVRVTLMSAEHPEYVAGHRFQPMDQVQSFREGVRICGQVDRAQPTVTRVQDQTVPRS